jgi:cellulose synthase/poly-beta-1,6-N-acetylglucosamine synthase-like glycosyltransferase
MTEAANALLSLLALPATFSALYLAALTLLSARGVLPPLPPRRLCFDVVVPAHDEAGVIQRTVANLLRLDWPHQQFRIVVVADNCSDATAALARAAGAMVLERHDAGRRGKGYALDFAFRHCLDEGLADAIAVVDADSEVSPNLLEAFAARLELGALAVQAHYGGLNVRASWRTRLLTIAKAAFHIARSRARERLRLSCGIRGNGRCVATGLLLAMPYEAYSLAEDLEFGISLGLAGYRVHYADEAHANADMVTVGSIARTQRQRWEDGRARLIRSRSGPLLLAAVQQPSLICLDLALDLLLLPLSYVVLNIALLALAAWLLPLWLPLWQGWRWLDLGCAAAALLYVLRGWQLSGLGWSGLSALLYAPFFIAWKLLIMVSRRESSGWIRTRREGG